VPRGKDFCLYENDFFDAGEFEVRDGVRLHESRSGAPLHRQDGVVVLDESRVRPAKEISIPPPPSIATQ
jgi:hypothetical protein